MAELVLLVVRGAVALSCGAFAVVAVTHWAVTRGHLSPFGTWARGMRELTGPLLRPAEKMVVARGGDPRQTPYWLLGAGVVAGLILLSVTQWLIGYVSFAIGAARGGVRGILAFLAFSACDLLALVLLVRVIGSWFGIGRYTAWMRPFHQVTDWLIRPLQRVIPPVGMFDLTPLVAWIIVGWVFRPLLAALLR